MSDAELLAMPEAELDQKHSAGEIDLAHLVSLKAQLAGATDDVESVQARLQKDQPATVAQSPEKPKIYPWERIPRDVQERAKKLFDAGWSQRGIYEELPGVSGSDLGVLFELWGDQKIPQEQREAERRAKREAGEAKVRKWQALADTLAFELAQNAAAPVVSP